MRNQEAARYASWAAYGAGAIVLVVTGVYAGRAIRAARARRNAPVAVPATVQQASAQFSFSKVEQDRTLFTVRASHAIQFKDTNRALLEDVWITVYGRNGERNDNVHTRECSYAPDGGDVRCEGAVQIDLAAAQPTAKSPLSAAPGSDAPAVLQEIQITTSNLSFNRDSGQASTPAPVDFQFAGGHGSGVGVAYSSNDSTLRVEHDVSFEVAASERTNNMPVSATGSSLEVHRDDRQVLLHDPATVREGARELDADLITLTLDEANRVQRVVAEGHPHVRTQEGGVKVAIQAGRIEASLGAAGWIESITAEGNVAGSRDANQSTDRFSAARAVVQMIPGANLAKEMTATGHVQAESKQGADSRVLKTEALRVEFAGTAQRKSGAAGASAKQGISRAETLAPATIESVASGERTTLEAKKFVVESGETGRPDKLFGHDGVNVHRQTGKEAPQDISAAEMVATFAPGGDWETVDEKGGVHFRQADRQVTAAHANFVRSTNTVTLDGSPVLSDSQSRTTAANVVINQQSDDIRATGGVVSSYAAGAATAKSPKDQAAAQPGAVGLGSGEAHVAADTFSASLTSGRGVYEGHARLWQGDSVLDADRIELFRDEKRLLAIGRVAAVFVQQAGPLSHTFGQTASASSAGRSAPATRAVKSVGAKSAGGGSTGDPELWKVSAPSLSYWSDQGRAHLEGGVLASSAQGSLQSQTMDVFLASPVQANAAPSTSTATADSGARELNRVLAQGSVVVRQGDRTGIAQQAEYTASDGKFVLSGGQPTLADTSSNTVTGRSLTFFSASDTILIDSQEGSRTLTKHRVEK